MDIAALAAEITNDPESLGYAGKTDAEVAVLLNAPTRSVVVPRTSSEALLWLAGGGRYDKIETGASALQPSPEIRSICKAVLRLVERDATVLDLTDPANVAMLDALVAASVITADDRADLMAMVTTQMSRAAELGLGRVKPGHVNEARA